MTKLISAVQNFNTAVIPGSQAQTVTKKVTIVDHIGTSEWKRTTMQSTVWPDPSGHVQIWILDGGPNA
ncbi:hypothetical protein [Alloactinosynnema sp. L-07]|uniref:hypothetical protein n=1 Tax=Alloactinosynnema sp. L-07 TaxID=1653480 RepID=UPI0012F7DDCB|nr:hypothetical protein [Alloactinosynnema sp. L-07]